MNEYFIEGFVKQAVDSGLSDNTIALLFKRAMASPQAAGMFKTPPPLPAMPVDPMAAQQAPGQDPMKMAILQRLMAAQQQVAVPQI